MIGKLLDHYSPQEVPEHQVLFSFASAEEVDAFHAWWKEVGDRAFASWLVAETTEAMPREF